MTKAVSIEGIGFPPSHRVHGPASDRLRYWLEARRDIEKRKQKPYPSLDAAMARMKEANPHLSDEVARHLTLHGTNWDSEGCLTWKFDNYARAIGPFGHNLADTAEIYGQITSPTLLFWGLGKLCSGAGKRSSRHRHATLPADKGAQGRPLGAP